MTRLLVAWCYVGVGLPTSGGTIISHPFLWPTVLEKGCFALSDFHSLMEVETWIESGQTTSEVVSGMMYARARQTGTQVFSIFIDPGREVKVSYLCLGDTFYARPGNCGPQGIHCWKYGILRAGWRCCESRGFWAMHQVVRTHTCFTCPHFHRLVSFCWLGLVVGEVCLLCFCFLFVHWPICAIKLSTDDQFSISSWLHCRYDERSVVQKKNRKE